MLNKAQSVAPPAAPLTTAEREAITVDGVVAGPAAAPSAARFPVVRLAIIAALWLGALVVLWLVVARPYLARREVPPAPASVTPPADAASASVPPPIPVPAGTVPAPPPSQVASAPLPPVVKPPPIVRPASPAPRPAPPDAPPEEKNPLKTMAPK